MCKLVGQRAANLVGTAIAALIRHTGRDMPSTHLGSNGALSETAGEIPHTVVSADGSLILKYDKFRWGRATVGLVCLQPGSCSAFRGSLLVDAAHDNTLDCGTGN